MAMQYRRIIEGLLVRTRLDSVLLAKEWMYSVLVSELRDGAVIPIDLKKMEVHVVLLNGLLNKTL